MESIEKLEAARVEKLEQLAKSAGVTAVAKHILAEGPSGLTKADFNRMCNVDWQRDRQPNETYDQCFARHYSAPDTMDVRKAELLLDNFPVMVVGGGDAQDVDNPSAAVDAYEQLVRIGREKFSHLTPAQQFEKAFETHPELARQAHRRPAPTTSFPMPGR
jgi:hypothetical protein